MRRFLKAVFVLLLIGVVAFLTLGPGYVEKGRNAVADHEPYPVTPQAQALHNRLIIGDWHADTLLWQRSLLNRANRGQVDLPRLIEGNATLQMFTAVTKSPAGQNYHENSADAFDNITPLAVGQLWPPRTWNSLLERALYQAKRLHSYADASDGRLRVIKTRADLEQLLADRANGQQVVGGLLGIEGSHPLEGDIANLDKIEAAGHRMIALQHFFDNELGGSLHGTGDHGLTDFGRQVVSEVAARNLILDLAHSSPQVARDVLAMTDIPLVVSHTGIHSVCPVKRNFTDDLMQDIAATGGVIAIGYWADVTCDDSPAGIAATIKAAVELLGDDHVSLGSDFDGSVATSFDASELAALTQALLDTGLSDETIGKVMGGNMVRVLRERLP
ncbi:microsomal dipeptidase-like Zn-dependent dipeptidase [Yoonia maritima]|uniref:Microsomal dipeptidase-like Zn-dependent dipeptidase n=1 Tax=Yoonia maritima TaxID=1435347 RepID=A0A2T0VYZ0_9RHOB|nr:membrane dipeptidase [Yoonia maritima]PRY77303.1 microsomal dipeptidase-like Zn-dependent dipeptidase [Yoonia maritima]